VEAHGGDRGGVDEARDVFFAGDAEQGAGAFDVGAVHGVGIADPEAVVGGDVEDSVAAADGVAEGVRFEEVADDGLGG
jgi:hypothetical protein